MSKSFLFVFFILFNLNALNGQSTNNDSIKIDKEIRTLIDASRKAMKESNNSKSLEYAKKALSLSLKNNFARNTAVAYNLIALNFYYVDETDDALKYYNKSLVYATKVKNDTVLSWVYNNLGNLYGFRKKEPLNAIKFYSIAINHSKKSDPIEYYYNVVNLASTYGEIANYEKVKSLLNEIKPHLDTLENEPELRYLYYFLNGNYYKWRSFNYLAEENFLKAYSICLSKPDKFTNTYELDISLALKTFYENSNSFENAKLFSAKADSLQNKFFNLEQEENIKVLTQQIEKEEVKNELDKVELARNVQSEKLLNFKIFAILVIVVFLATLLLLYYQFKLNRIRKVSNAELKLANEALVIAKEKAEEATILKSQFVSTISHELRTPLYGVIGITDIIETEHKELENSPHLKALQFSAKYLLALVNDVLKVQKFEENSMELDNSLFSIKEKLDIIKHSLAVIAKNQGNQIQIEFDENIPEYLYGDSIRLSQIIINLVSNSLKFTKNGLVKIIANLDNTNDDSVVVSFVVSDNGSGVPEAYQDKIFDKFVQINRKEDDYQGTGLGLTIVKKLITLFNGTIKLESKENVGTTVTFTIPFKAGRAIENEFINNIEVAVETPSILNILLVEDNKINQMVTKKLLENHNFVCEVAEDGYLAIEMLSHKKYDAVLMDINMPKINGFETTKLIRAKEITIPIIALTAFEKEEVYSFAIESGLNDVLAKPFDPIILFKMIRKYAQTQRVP